MKSTLVCLLAFSLVSCGEDDATHPDGAGGGSGVPLPKVNCQDGPVPTYADLSNGAFKKCDVCHGSTNKDRHDAPPEVSFDVEAQAKQNAQVAASLVYSDVMPFKQFINVDGGVPASEVTLTDAEKTSIYRWALCGTP